MAREPYPLAWPEGWNRTPLLKRRTSRFKGTQFIRARDGIVKALKLMRATHAVITSDLPVKSNGMPYATGRAEDPGIAVWWVRNGKEQVIACDLYKTPGENLRAIQLTLDAIRGIERWGASDLVERAFAGFAALPSGSGSERVREWWEILEIDNGLFQMLDADDLSALIKTRYRRLSNHFHPDRGGDPERMIEVNKALEAAEAYLKDHVK